MERAGVGRGEGEERKGAQGLTRPEEKKIGNKKKRESWSKGVREEEVKRDEEKEGGNGRCAEAEWRR